jgi:hypothetical protein
MHSADTDLGTLVNQQKGAGIAEATAGCADRKPGIKGAGFNA